MAKGEKPQPPYERKDNALVKISEAEVERILREYARSLNLRGYPPTEEEVTIEIHECGWKDSNTYVGGVLLRFEVM